MSPKQIELKTTKYVSSSSESNLGKGTTTEKPNGRPDLTPIKEAVPWILEDSALRDLWQACRKAAPDITPKEVANLCSLKVKLKGNNIRNAAGFLLASVPRACEGQSLEEYRDWAKAQGPV
jgi:hypothetical protein